MVKLTVKKRQTNQDSWLSQTGHLLFQGERASGKWITHRGHSHTDSGLTQADQT